MDLKKRREELVAEHEKANDLIQQYSAKAVQISGAITMLDEIIKDQQSEQESESEG